MGTLRSFSAELHDLPFTAWARLHSHFLDLGPIPRRWLQLCTRLSFLLRRIVHHGVLDQHQGRLSVRAIPEMLQMSLIAH
jgi:hypothetical protein